ncbi:VOC family protein [Nakamurella deserti]|uniref:VOC family protein n=1 Tax=Nakamurella deserti TaxID=2164074 RepID=UPI000DBE3A74|nr:VOC family protein [Nakamurella deserti]
MPLRFVSVTLDAPDPARRAAFWAASLGRAVIPDDGFRLPGDPTQVGLRFVDGRSGHPAPSASTCR